MRLFSGDNIFTRMMNWIGVLVITNLMFILCCLPVVTLGAGLSALYYTMLCALRDNGDIRPAKTFWTGFRDNFRQATMSWLVLLVLAVLIYLEIFWCGQFSGPITVFRYGLYALGLGLSILASYLFPIMETFRGNMAQHLKNSLGFVCSAPVTALTVLFFSVIPMAWTFFTNAYLPLYAFLWCTIGFSGIAMMCSKSLLPLFLPYLSNENGHICTPQKSEHNILEEMKKLEM